MKRGLSIATMTLGSVRAVAWVGLIAIGTNCGGSAPSTADADSAAGPDAAMDASAMEAGGLDGGDASRDSAADTAPRDAGMESGCSSAAMCANGGVCLQGACCTPPATVCGTACCPSGQACVFAQCVTPGAACTLASDCPAGDYCETDLGSNETGGDAGADGGTSDGGAACTESPPTAGRCLPLPSTTSCEFHPPAVGILNAVAAWQWAPSATDVRAAYQDVWTTPVVARLYDANCDGRIDANDPPDVVFIAGNVFAGAPNGANCQTANLGGASPSMCHTAALRVIDGATGNEIWTLPSVPGSVGFAGIAPAVGDVDGDGVPDILAVTGEGNVVMLSHDGALTRASNLPLAGVANSMFGWGGGLALADMDGDGFPEIAYGASVFTTTAGAITVRFTGPSGIGGPANYDAMSIMVDLDGAPNDNIELLAGNTAYTSFGSFLWNRMDLPDGFNAVGDFDENGTPDVVLVGPVGTAPVQANVWILNGANGTNLLGPVALTTTHASNGGPPVVADFDGDGKPEIALATADYYWMLKPNFVTNTIDIVWRVPNHDLTSSVTSSAAVDFEGDGRAEVLYADECYFWIFDGSTGAVRFAAPHTSFTGTESPVVADVDGDGHSEVIVVSNGVDPSNAGYGCMNATGTAGTVNGVMWTPSALPNHAYRGLTAYRDAARGWIGGRTLWNEATYHVTNICDDQDSACAAPNTYGSIPTHESPSWTLPWDNGFRLAVEDGGIFDAPDAVVALSVGCTLPLEATATVRNIGSGILPAGVMVTVYRVSPGDGGTDASADGGIGTAVGSATTTRALQPGQSEDLVVPVPAGSGGLSDTYLAQVVVDPAMPTFEQCVTSNDTSAPATSPCLP